MSSRQAYPSDLSREQFAKIEPMLLALRNETRPRKHDLYDVVCGILYRNATGCAWRSLPPGFPPWRTVHEYFKQWRMETYQGTSVLAFLYKELGVQDLWGV